MDVSDLRHVNRNVVDPQSRIQAIVSLSYRFLGTNKLRRGLESVKF